MQKVKNYLTCRAEIEIQCGCKWMIYANRVWKCPVTWPKCFRPKMGRKWTILSRYASVNTDIDGKWVVNFEHTINQFFGYVRLPQPKYYFSSLLFFSFFILLRLSFSKPLNALYLKLERLVISGRTSVELKSGVPGWGDFPQSSPPKFETFKLLELDGSNFRSG